MKYNVMITQQAEHDLIEIHNYISYTLLSPENAQKQLKRLENSILGLELYPKRFKLYQKEPWCSRELRIMPVDNFLVFYTSDDKSFLVTILRVMYSGRDIISHL